MQNIDLILLLQPSLAFVISLFALVWWWYRRGFRGVVLLLSAAAYFVAIGAKYAIQIPTIAAVQAEFGKTSLGLGLYYGLQTVFLEVGLAYLFAVYAVRRRGLKESDAVPYGLSLAFWENGILLGIFSIFNLGIIYLIIAGGGSEAATVYSQILASQPSLFQSSASLLPMVFIGTLERVSSMLAHIAWGMLCVFSAVTGRKRYLVYALPMGLLDALVPFASLNLNLFEAVVFVLSLVFVLIAWRSSESVPMGPQPGTGISQASETRTNGSISKD